MNKRSLHTETWLPRAFVSFVLSTTVYFGSANEADNDLWMHLFVGRQIWEVGAVPRVDSFSYTAAGQPWVDHEWLAQWAAYGLFYHAGDRALWLAKLGMVVLMVVVLWFTIRRAWRSHTGRGNAPDASFAEWADDSPYWVWGPLLVLVLAVTARGLSFRPQLWTYAFLPLLLWALSRWSAGQTFWGWFLPLLFVVWVNVHGGFVLGLGVFALFAAWGLFAGGREVGRRTLLFAASALATLVNPYGGELFPYLIDELGRWHPISEWQRVALGDPAHVPFFLLLVSFMATLPWARDVRGNGWQLVLSLGTAYFAVLHQRHTPVFALCVALPLARQWSAAGRALLPRGLGLSAAATVLLAWGIGLLAATQLLLVAKRIAWENGTKIVFSPHDYPVGLVAALRRAGAAGNLAVPLDWGGYVLWHLAPQVRPSLDGRFATVFPPQVVEDNFAFYAGGAGWRRLLDEYLTEAVLLASGARHPLRHDVAWVELASDGVASLWVRRGLEARFAVDPVISHPSQLRQGRFP